MSDEPRAQIREALLTHIRQHPFASDTPDGIRRWWLPVAMGVVQPDLLTSVLDELVADGRMRCRRLPDGGVLYGVAGMGD